MATVSSRSFANTRCRVTLIYLDESAVQFGSCWLQWSVNFGTIDKLP